MRMTFRGHSQRQRPITIRMTFPGHRRKRWARLGAGFDHVICQRTGKRSYRTLREAEADIARFRGRPGRQPHRAYQCTYCYGIHLTADPRRRRETQ